MDPILSEFAKGGPMVLAFAILLAFVLKMYTEERKHSYEERKAGNEREARFAEERGQNLATLNKAVETLGVISRTQEAQQDALKDISRAQESIAADVSELKRWREGHATSSSSGGSR